jgi:cell division transport system permease protein
MAKNLSDNMRENINISLLLDDSMSEAEKTAFETRLKNMPCVKDIVYVSKEQAAEEEAKAMGADPSEFIGYNPFTASFEVKLQSEYANIDSLQSISDRLKKDSKVVDVIYEKELIKSVNDNIKKISIILLVIAAIFTYISFTLINNTVRLSIFSQRFLINTMKLVGASWWFIRKPFLKRGLVLGIFAAVVADVALYFGVEAMKKQEPDIVTVITPTVMYSVGAMVLVFGLLITFLCTYLSLNKYLKMSSNELYHI